MPDTFVPAKPEKYLRVEITGREAHLLKVLRKYNFGKIMVYKANNIIVRVESTESEMIEEDKGLDLAT